MPTILTGIRMVDDVYTWHMMSAFTTIKMYSKLRFYYSHKQNKKKERKLLYKLHMK